MSWKHSFFFIMTLLLSAFFLGAEVITATSDPFVFPAFANVKQPKSTIQAPSFTARGFSTITRSLNLNWSVPASVNAKTGVITLLSLQGKTIKTFRITSRSGSIAWKVPADRALTGVLIAHLSYGRVASSLKLIICR
jgi:hypothetical protein